MDFKMMVELPVDLLRHRVWSLLTIKCLVRLDSAVCDRRARPKLHESLGGARTAVDVPGRFPPRQNLHVYVWLNSREIHPTNFTICDNVNFDSMVERGMLSRLANIQASHRGRIRYICAREFDVYGRDDECKLLERTVCVGKWCKHM